MRGIGADEGIKRLGAVGLVVAGLQDGLVATRRQLVSLPSDNVTLGNLMSEVDSSWNVAVATGPGAPRWKAVSPSSSTVLLLTVLVQDGEAVRCQRRRA